MEQKTLETKIFILQTDFTLQNRKFEEDFSQYVNREYYPSINKCSEYIHFCFRSTYLCELAFFCLKLTKNSMLTDRRSEDSLI